MAMSENFAENISSADDSSLEVVYKGVTDRAALSREEMREADRRAIEDFGIPGLLLMENAAMAVVREVENYAAFAVVCGVGNNGGDGLAVARHLCVLGRDVRVFLLGDPERGSAGFQKNLEILNRLAPEAVHFLNGDAAFEDFEYALKGCEACIDAIFGTGLSRPVEGLCLRAVEAMNRHATHIVSVDIPSGLDANTGQELGAAVRAHQTVTFHRMKRGLLTLSGIVTVAYIGIP